MTDGVGVECGGWVSNYFPGGVEAFQYANYHCNNTQAVPVPIKGKSSALHISPLQTLEHREPIVAPVPSQSPGVFFDDESIFVELMGD